MSPIIRLSTIQDLSRLAEINSLGTEEGRLEAKKELPRFIEANNLIVAEMDGEIIGLLYWEEKFFGKGRWFLTQVTVDENHRRKGIAESLIKDLFERAKRQEIKEIYADVRVSNIPSTNLVKKLGAVKAGSLDLDDGDPRIFYRWKI